MKHFRVTWRVGPITHTVTYECASFFDRARAGGESRMQCTVGADVVEAIELVDLAEPGLPAPSAPAVETAP